MLRVSVASIVLVAAMLGLSTPALAQAPRVLDLKFGTDGLVTLSAQNVTVREILAEWARQCSCFVVNADRLGGAPLAVPVAFVSAPQPDVLRSLLRETGGYALTPRRAGSTSVSQYETIFIINPSAPVAYASPAAPITPIVIRGAPDDEIPPVLPLVIGAELPAGASTPSEMPSPQAQPSRAPSSSGGFVITPVTPVSSGSAAPTAPPLPTQPTAPAQPGRVTPSP